MHTKYITREHRAVDWERAVQLVERHVLSQDDAQELTDTVLAQARPARDVLHELFPAVMAETLLKTQGRRKLVVPKEQAGLQLAADVLAH